MVHKTQGEEKHIQNTTKHRNHESEPSKTGDEPTCSRRVGNYCLSEDTHDAIQDLFETPMRKHTQIRHQPPSTNI